MGARRVDRETAESVAVIAGSGSFPEQVDYGMPITRIRYGSVAGDAWPSQSSRAASAPLIPLGLLAAAVVIIFALLRMVTRESSLYLSMHRERMLIIMANSATEMIFTPRWYTVAQVAQLLHYGESKVRMLIITGQLRSIKDGRSRRILPEWVEAYVQDRAKSTEDIW
jgi:excisionase family DNA binding protein